MTLTNQALNFADKRFVFWEFCNRTSYFFQNLFITSGVDLVQHTTDFHSLKALPLVLHKGRDDGILFFTRHL